MSGIMVGTTKTNLLVLHRLAHLRSHIHSTFPGNFLWWLDEVCQMFSKVCGFYIDPDRNRLMLHCPIGVPMVIHMFQDIWAVYTLTWVLVETSPEVLYHDH
jgi:hypothetical protein